jgi:hypothetical protein
MGGQFVDLDVVGRVFRVRPAKDSVCGCMENVLSVGASKVRGEWDVETAMDRCIGGMR